MTTAARRRKSERPPVRWAGSEELRRFREEFGLTKQKMADLLRQHRFLTGLSWGVYYGWERGTVHPRPPYEDAVHEVLALERAKRAAESKAARRAKADGHGG